MANISFIAGNKGSDGTTVSTESHNSCGLSSSFGQYKYVCVSTDKTTVTAKGSPGADGGFKINFKYLLRNEEISIEANGGGGAGGAKGSASYRRCDDPYLGCGIFTTHTLVTQDGKGGSSTNGNSGNGANGGDATTNNNFKWRGSAIVNVWKYKEI